MYGRIFRGCDPIFPENGGTSTLARGVALARGDSMSSNQSAISQWGWGFHILRSGIDPENICFRSRVLGDLYIWKYF